MFWPSALWAIGAILPMSGGRHGRQDLREDTSGPGVSPWRCRKGCACYVPDHLYTDNLVVFLCWIIICFVHMKMVKARCGSWFLKKCIYCFMSCMPTVSWSCRPSKESLHQSQHWCIPWQCLPIVLNKTCTCQVIHIQQCAGEGQAHPNLKDG